MIRLMAKATFIFFAALAAWAVVVLPITWVLALTGEPQSIWLWGWIIVLMERVRA